MVAATAPAFAENKPAEQANKALQLKVEEQAAALDAIREWEGQITDLQAKINVFKQEIAEHNDHIAAEQKTIKAQQHEIDKANVVLNSDVPSTDDRIKAAVVTIATAGDNIERANAKIELRKGAIREDEAEIAKLQAEIAKLQAKINEAKALAPAPENTTVAPTSKATTPAPAAGTKPAANNVKAAATATGQKVLPKTSAAK